MFPFKIKFEYIKGIKNTLADTMSRLITTDQDIKLDPEAGGHEFGYYVFDTLHSVSTLLCKKLS